MTTSVVPSDISRDAAEKQAQESDGAGPMTGDIVLALKGATKQYGSAVAVDDVSIEVCRGEVMTLLGPSGSGVSTLLRLAMGLERLSAGEIRYAGQLLDSATGKQFVPPQKRNIGMVFPSYAVWPHMTVAENVAYPLKVRGVPSPEIRERVARVLEQVGLGGIEQRRGTALSAAQQHGVALARSLVFDPEILLLDEPFADIAPELRDGMRADLRVLQQRMGFTMVLATHDPLDALNLSGRIAVVNEGRLEQVGRPAQLYKQPATRFVSDLFGRTVVMEGVVEEATASGTRGVRVHDGSGPLVHAQVADAAGIEVGTQVTLGVRPAGFKVEPLETAPSPDAPNTLRGIISTLLFAGDGYEARVELPWGDDIVLGLPADSDWREGQPVAMRLAPENIVVWPSTAEELTPEVVQETAEVEETAEAVVPDAEAAA
jgi:ABC-type Fe3+/spermidine/putrescine transport system ATPase subunit